MPGIGIISGSVLNLSFMSDVENTAHRVFQERWLKDNGKIREIEPAIKPVHGTATGWAGLMGRGEVAPVCYGVTFAAALPVFAAAALGGNSGRTAVDDREAWQKGRSSPTGDRPPAFTRAHEETTPGSRLNGSACQLQRGRLPTKHARAGQCATSTGLASQITA